MVKFLLRVRFKTARKCVPLDVALQVLLPHSCGFATLKTSQFSRKWSQGAWPLPPSHRCLNMWVQKSDNRTQSAHLCLMWCVPVTAAVASYADRVHAGWALINWHLSSDITSRVMLLIVTFGPNIFTLLSLCLWGPSGRTTAGLKTRCIINHWLKPRKIETWVPGANEGTDMFLLSWHVLVVGEKWRRSDTFTFKLVSQSNVTTPPAVQVIGGAL